MSERTETVKEVTVHPHLIISQSNYFAEQYRMLMRQFEVKIKRTYCMYTMIATT